MGVNGKGDRDQMVRLNEKLALYMQKVRTLGSSDSVVFLDTLRCIESDMKTLKCTYEKELDKCRLSLEEANRRKNEAESESEKNKRAASDLEDWYRVEKDKNGKLLCDINLLKEKIADMEKELSMARAACQGPQQQLNVLQCEVNKERSKSQDLAKALDCEKAKTKQLLDTIKGMQSKVEFSDQLTCETTRESNNRLEQAKKIITDMETKNRELQRRNDGLPQLLEQMRKKTEQDIQMYQKDVEYTNRKNTETLRVQIEEQTRSVEQLRADNAKLERENQDMMTRLRNMEGQMQDLKNQKANLESQICQERARCSDNIKSLEVNLKSLQEQLLAKMQEVNAGKDAQVSLKAEIEAYRVLLEEEETRLGSPMGRAQSQSGYVKQTNNFTGRGSGMNRNGRGSGMDRNGRGSGMDQNGRGSGMDQNGRGSGMDQNGRGSGMDRSGLGSGMDKNGRGSGMDRNRRTKTPNKTGAGGNSKYETRTEYQYAYSRFGRSTLPRIG